MRGGEHGDGQYRYRDVEDPAQDAEQEADEGERRQHVGQYGAGNDEQAQQGRDQGVGDLPGGLEHIEPLADEGDRFEQPRAGGGAHERRHGGERGVQQAVAERGEIGDGVAAVGDDDGVQVDELEQPRHHAAALTSAAIDARDFRRARKDRETSAHLPDGTLVAITGGKNVTDADAVWTTLDRAREKHGDMVLLHGGGPGIEKIAASWADARGVDQVVCRPDWNAHGKAAPFRRNDELLNLARRLDFVAISDTPRFKELQ